MKSAPGGDRLARSPREPPQLYCVSLLGAILAGAISHATVHEEHCGPRRVIEFRRQLPAPCLGAHQSAAVALRQPCMLLHLPLAVRETPHNPHKLLSVGPISGTHILGHACIPIVQPVHRTENHHVLALVAQRQPQADQRIRSWPVLRALTSPCVPAFLELRLVSDGHTLLIIPNHEQVLTTKRCTRGP